MTTYADPKYARREFERKFLLERMPDGASADFRSIHDRYFPNTTLRLRLITSADGKVLARKLTQKRRDESGIIWLTNTYLSEAEFRLLEALPAVSLKKRRHSVAGGPRKFCVDVIALAEHELLLTEIEGDSMADISSDIGLPPYVREVTYEPEFEGYQLALRASEQNGKSDHGGKSKAP